MLRLFSLVGIKLVLLFVFLAVISTVSYAQTAGEVYEADLKKAFENSSAEPSSSDDQGGEEEKKKKEEGCFGYEATPFVGTPGSKAYEADKVAYIKALKQAGHSDKAVQDCVTFREICSSGPGVCQKEEEGQDVQNEFEGVPEKTPGEKYEEALKDAFEDSPTQPSSQEKQSGDPENQSQGTREEQLESEKAKAYSDCVFSGAGDSACAEEVYGGSEISENNTAKELTVEEKRTLLQQKMKAAGLTIENCDARCRDYVADMVYAEASTIKDPRAFQQVAEVIKNRALCKSANSKCNFPSNPLGVITQGCQFSPNCNGKFTDVGRHKRNTDAWKKARATVDGVFDGTITPEFMDQDGNGHLYFANIDYVLNTKQGRADSSAKTRARLRQDLADPGSITTGGGSRLQHTSSVGRIKSHAPDYSVLGDDLVNLRTPPAIVGQKAATEDVLNTFEKNIPANIRKNKVYQAFRNTIATPGNFSQNPVGVFGSTFGNFLGGGNDTGGDNSPFAAPFNLAGTQNNTPTIIPAQFTQPPQQQLNGLLDQQRAQLQNVSLDKPEQVEQMLRQQQGQLEQFKDQNNSLLDNITVNQLDQQIKALEQQIAEAESIIRNDTQSNANSPEKIKQILDNYYDQTEALKENPNSQVFTEINPTSSNLTVTALRASDTLTNEYRFVGTLSRELTNSSGFSDTGGYFGNNLTHELMLDLQCDGTIDASKQFATPYYSVSARTGGAEVLLSEYMEVKEEGAHCFAFVTDIDDVLPETDESDNQSAWRDFRTTGNVSANNLPALNFEVSVYTDSYANLTQDWTSSDVIISVGQEIAFRWDAPEYTECTPLLSALTAGSLDNRSPVERNTLTEGIEIHERTGYYEVQCRTGNDTRVESVHVRVE